jgi:hypothetical protein
MNRNVGASDGGISQHVGHFLAIVADLILIVVSWLPAKATDADDSDM